MTDNLGTAKDSASFEVFIDNLAELLEEAARLFLDGISATPEPPHTSTWLDDRETWTSTYRSEDVAGWVSETSAIYLAESGHLLRALAGLLRSRRIFATLDVIVRAVVERVGHVNWILDHRISSEERGARAGLELAVCFYMYRDNLHLLDAEGEARTKIRAEARAQQGQLKQWFEVVRPPDDPCDENSPATGDVRRWVVSGEKFPNLTTSAQFALEQGSIGATAAAGTYAALSGFSHPNVVYSREHRDIDAGGRITFRYERQEIEKAVRMALFSFTDGMKHWVGYYDADQIRVVAHLDDIAGRLEQICGPPPEIEEV